MKPGVQGPAAGNSSTSSRAPSTKSSSVTSRSNISEKVARGGGANAVAYSGSMGNASGGPTGATQVVPRHLRRLPSLPSVVTSKAGPTVSGDAGSTQMVAGVSEQPSAAAELKALPSAPGRRGTARTVLVNTLQRPPSIQQAGDQQQQQQNTPLPLQSGGISQRRLLPVVIDGQLGCGMTRWKAMEQLPGQRVTVPPDICQDVAGNEDCASSSRDGVLVLLAGALARLKELSNQQCNSASGPAASAVAASHSTTAATSQALSAVLPITNRLSRLRTRLAAAVQQVKEVTEGAMPVPQPLSPSKLCPASSASYCTTRTPNDPSSDSTEPRGGSATVDDQLRWGFGACYVDDLAADDPGNSISSILTLDIKGEKCGGSSVEQPPDGHTRADPCSVTSDDDSSIDQMVEGMFTPALPPGLL
jgi:hypothetical protein